MEDKLEEDSGAGRPVRPLQSYKQERTSALIGQNQDVFKK